MLESFKKTKFNLSLFLLVFFAWFSHSESLKQNQESSPQGLTHSFGNQAGVSSDTQNYPPCEEVDCPSFFSPPIVYCEGEDCLPPGVLTPCEGEDCPSPEFPTPCEGEDCPSRLGEPCLIAECPPYPSCEEDPSYCLKLKD